MAYTVPVMSSDCSREQIGIIDLDRCDVLRARLDSPKGERYDWCVIQLVRTPAGGFFEHMTNISEDWPFSDNDWLRVHEEYREELDNLLLQMRGSEQLHAFLMRMCPGRTSSEIEIGFDYFARGIAYPVSETIVAAWYHFRPGLAPKHIRPLVAKYDLTHSPGQAAPKDAPAFLEHYKPTEVKASLTEKARRGVMSPGIQPTPSPTQNEIDFLILTPLQEERDAVLRCLGQYRKLPPSEQDIRVYYFSDLPATFSDGSSTTYRVVVAPLLGMGRVEAANATGDAIHRWRPRYILLVGIGGGLAKAGVRLGDVLISDQIVDYELQKLTTDSSTTRWQVHRVDPRLLGAAQNFLGDEWQQFIEHERPDLGKPKLHFGPICTGDKVFANGLMDEHREVWSKLIGVEMEAGGAASAAYQAANSIGFFMIRSVSDLADAAKDSSEVVSWRAYACEVAALYLIALLRSGPIPPALSPDIERRSPEAENDSTRPHISPTESQRVVPNPSLTGVVEAFVDGTVWRARFHAGSAVDAKPSCPRHHIPLSPENWWGENWRCDYKGCNYTRCIPRLSSLDQSKVQYVRFVYRQIEQMVRDGVGYIVCADDDSAYV